VAMTVLAAVLLLWPNVFDRPRLLNTACVLAFAGIWIEKGMGMIIPGFVPSTLHEMVEYAPSLIEWKVMAGIWALGLMIYTIALKLAGNTLRHPAGGHRAAPVQSQSLQRS
jgi:Ni/Fe-hydrogenase subunit HybB-like protein